MKVSSQFYPTLIIKHTLVVTNTSVVVLRNNLVLFNQFLKPPTDNVKVLSIMTENIEYEEITFYPNQNMQTIL